jgi:WD40 repeat protein
LAFLKIKKGTIVKQLLPILTLLILWGCNPSTPPKPTTKNITQERIEDIATEAILRLDTYGHTAIIGDIIVSKSGDIISASDDKTVRIWNGETGKEKRKILGEIGTKGEIFSIALSPNEEFLAVGGYFKGIRIYHYPTGRLINILKSHTNVILDLAFSPKGEYLISGSSDSTAKVWNSKNWTLQSTISTHNKAVYAVKIIEKDGKNFAITTGYDKKLSKYSIENKKTVKTIQVESKLKYLASSSKHIAVCGKSKKILIFDYNLKTIHTIKSESKPSGLSYSIDGTLLIAGTSEKNVNIYDSTVNYKKISTFTKHNNLTMAVGFIDNKTAISGGGNNKEIYIWDIATNNVKYKIEGVGNSIWSVGVNKNIIGWGNKSRDVHNPNSLDIRKSINLEDFSISDKINQTNFSPIPRKKNRLLLSSKSNRYSDPTLELIENGKIITSIKRDASSGYGHNCYGFYKNFIISGGSHGHLDIYDFKGKKVTSLIGHTGEVWTIALDGDKLVSGSGDQTIRVWDLSKITKQSIISPSLNIFISRNNEWVIWSKSGYFNSSVNGDKYVGYHINRGVNHEAHYVRSDKYYKTLYRPDIIENIWATGDETTAIKLASKKKNVKDISILTSLPPVISLLSPSTLTTSEDSVNIEYDIVSQSKVEKLLVTRNGQKVETRAVRIKTAPSVRVDLEEGTNIITIRAKNKSALSDSVIIKVVKKSSSPKNIYKPILYLLSIGVSKYENSDYNLDLADVDARDIASMFKKQEGKIYKKVVLKTLLNEQATSGNIMDALDWIEKETTQKDMAIIFIAGHGINDDKGNYYFMSHNGNTEKLRRTAVKWIEIEDTIKELPSKVVLLVDTCHSGNIRGSGKRRDITSAIKSIVNSGVGSVIMTATTGRGYSYEKSEWGHGAFTKSLLESIEEGKADYNKDGEISIKEMDLYITERVKKLTHGKQKPTTVISESIPDFTIGINTN